MTPNCYILCFQFRFGGSAANIDISFDGINDRLKKDVPSTDSKDTGTMTLPVYEGTEIVSGKVDISIPSGKKVDHLGIKIEMLGFVGKKMSHDWLVCCDSY